MNIDTVLQCYTDLQDARSQLRFLRHSRNPSRYEIDVAERRVQYYRRRLTESQHDHAERLAETISHQLPGITPVQKSMGDGGTACANDAGDVDDRSAKPRRGRRATGPAGTARQIATGIIGGGVK